MKTTSLSKSEKNKLKNELNQKTLFKKMRLKEVINLVLISFPIIFIIFIFIGFEIKGILFSLSFTLLLISLLLIIFYTKNKFTINLKRDLIDLKKNKNISKVIVVDKFNKFIQLEDDMRLQTLFHRDDKTDGLTFIKTGDLICYRATKSGYLVFKLEKLDS